DRITVLRNGELVGEWPVAELSQVQLVAKMMGKDLNDMESLEQVGQKSAGSDEVVYKAQNLSSTESRPFDFSIRKGEVNGFTGLLGSGRSESVRAIFGADRVTGGRVSMKGRDVRITKPHDAMKNGIGYLAEDRKRDGIIADLSVRENIIMALQVMKGFFHPMKREEMEAFADEYIKALQIKTASQDTPIGSLSGGNQQKVILARWLLTHPDYLILDEPTRGIDVGTKLEIQRLVLKLAEEGMSVTFISSEIEEMLRTCSRLIVMRDRNIVGELTGDQLTQGQIMQTIAGGKQ
ncbi:MAG: sugar ABC transporter ATP-binding protein, partial [Clostridia bacterium]|nr:sugar ABC transporter ATP-binding protein [Clostridia bacterium]